MVIFDEASKRPITVETLKAVTVYTIPEGLMSGKRPVAFFVTNQSATSVLTCSGDCGHTFEGREMLRYCRLTEDCRRLGAFCDSCFTAHTSHMQGVAGSSLAG
jgi:hypothetical protein